MAVKVLTPPAIEPVTLEQAKTHCRIDTDDEDPLIEGLIQAAREHCETFQNRAYCEQTLELWLDKFPAVGQIRLPRPPLLSVESVKYYDVDDEEFEFSPSEYFVDTKNEPGWVVLNYGASWPTETLRPANGICVTFVAGYETSGGSDETNMVPQAVKQAMLLLIGHWYENREAAGPNLNEIPKGVDALLWPNRNFQ